MCIHSCLLSIPCGMQPHVASARSYMYNQESIIYIAVYAAIATYSIYYTQLCYS